MSFPQEVIDAVWKKATYVDAGNEANGYRKDQCGAWIQEEEHGKTSKYGWEIDHIKPVSDGGADELTNLRPLHWENNRARSDGPLVCVVKSSGGGNVKS